MPASDTRRSTLISVKDSPSSRSFSTTPSRRRRASSRRSLRLLWLLRVTDGMSGHPTGTSGARLSGPGDGTVRVYDLSDRCPPSPGSAVAEGLREGRRRVPADRVLAEVQRQALGRGEVPDLTRT